MRRGSERLFESFAGAAQLFPRWRKGVIGDGAYRPQRFKRFDPEGAHGIELGNPIPHVGDSETEIGPVAVFLACDDSGYVTGNTIHVDGGGHINGVDWKPELPE